MGDDREGDQGDGSAASGAISISACRGGPRDRSAAARGRLAAVYVPEQLAIAVLRKGLYLAKISDETFELTVPDDFKPRSFQEPAAPAAAASPG